MFQTDSPDSVKEHSAPADGLVDDEAALDTPVRLMPSAKTGCAELGGLCVQSMATIDEVGAAAEDGQEAADEGERPEPERPWAPC